MYRYMYTSRSHHLVLIKYLDGIGWIGRGRYETAYPRVNGSTPLGARISISPPTPRSRRGGENSAETRGRLSRLFHYMFLLLVLFCITMNMMPLLAYLGTYACGENLYLYLY